MAELGARAYRFSIELAARPARRDRRHQPAGPRLLRAPRRRAARRRRPAADQPVPLGPAAGAAGPRRLRRPAGRRLVHRLRRAARVDPGRSGQGLDDVQRAGRASPSSAMPTASMRRGCATGRRRSGWPTTSCARMPRPPQAIRALVDDAKIGMAIDVNQVVPATDSERDRVAADAVELRARRVVPRSALRARLPGPGPRGAPRGRSPRRRRARRAAGRRSRLPRPELLPARLRQRQVGPPFDWEIGAVPGSEQTQMDWHVAPGRPARHPARAPPDVRPARDRGHRERRRLPRHRRAGRPGARRRRVEYLARHVAAVADASAPACR